MPTTSPLRARFQPGMERASPVRVFQSQLKGVVCRSQRLDVVRGFRSRIRRTSAKVRYSQDSETSAWFHCLITG